MKWFIRILLVLGTLVLAMFLMGSTLPQGHTASSTRVFSSPPAMVWAVLIDFESWPSWRSELKAIRAGHNSFTEVTADGDSVTYQIDDFLPPERLITRIITADLPYGGSWTYELTPSGEGCTLSITENGEVYNPIFRFMSRYLFGHTSTMNTFLDDLKKKIQ